MVSAAAWKFYYANRNAQLAGSALTLLLAITTLATGANTIRVYNQQHLTNMWWVPLWNSQFTTSGARALVGASGTAFILHSIYFLTSALPKFNLKDHPTISALNTTVATFLTSAIALMGIVFAHVLNHESPDVETIQSWTCAWSGSRSIPGSTKMSDIDNKDFASLCAQSRYAIWGELVIFILQVLIFTSALVGLICEKLAKRRVRKSSGTSSPDGSLELVGTGYDKHPTITTSVY